jgi:hypothetical protein
MTSWLDSALEQASNRITVNVADIGINLDEIEVLPLSAAEFQAIKSDPKIRKVDISDRAEVIGLRVVFEMMSKCDPDLSWGKFNDLPLNLLARIAERVTGAVGDVYGGGALGNS